MYWYDAAPYGGPSPDHQRIALLPNIKLRLGRIKSGRQKGVDALIYHDLVNLARERAISDAFLVSGDEDLREGVRTVQGLGVRVTLIGIPPSHSVTNQSLELIQEADERRELTKEVLSDFFRLKPRLTDDQHRLGTLEEADTTPTSQPPSNTAIAREAGSSLAKTLIGSPDLGSVLGSKPSIPNPIDRRLLSALRRRLETREVSECLRREARKSFWEALAATTDRS